MFSSIRWRIAFLYSLLIIVALGLLTGYLLNYVYGAFVESQRHQSFRQAALVASIARQSLEIYPDGRELDSLAKSLRPSLGERVTFIRSDGFVWGDSDEDPSHMDRHFDRVEVQGVLQSGQGQSIRESTTLGYSMLYVAVPLVYGDQMVGVARLATPLSDLSAAVGHIQRTVALAGTLVAALVVILGVYLSRSITAPVAELKAMANHMAAGDLRQRVDLAGRDELGSLAQSFNQMAGRLRATIEEITREQNQTAAVLTHMVDGVIAVEPDGRVGLMNPAAWQILGRAPVDLEGRSFAAVVRDHQLADVYRAVREAGGTEQERYCEVGNARRFTRVVAAGIPGEKGQRILMLLEDLSELRRLENVRRDFAANASHELRTPLASMRAVVETLEAGVDDPEIAQDFLRRMHVELDRLTQMTTELIELSRIESGQAAPRRRPMDLGQVARSAAEILRPQAERAGLDLSVELAEDIPIVEADPDRLQTVLVNLIHNAIKFTPSGGRVVVRTVVRGGEVGASVADNGVGIAETDIPRIFERFYKADRARSGGGTGLGLAIAKHIIQAHGGRIWAESVEGRGSAFSFLIPAV